MGKPLRRPWTADNIASMIHMRDVERKTFPVIDRALGRSPGCSKSKYESLRLGPAPRAGSVSGGRVTLSPQQEANQRARKDAENRMSLTATLFGDPPPGFSALDRRGT